MKIGFLFDLDGVLIDSEKEYTRIWSGIDACFPTGVADFAQAIKGTTLENILDTYFSAADQPAVKRLLYDSEQQMQYNYCDGAWSLLEELKRRGIPHVIVTSSKQDKMAHLRRQRPELFEMVDAIVDADDVTRSKPDPQGYLIGASKIGVSPQHCVVVEDSVQGMRAGRSAGCYVIGMTATFGRMRIEGEADEFLDSLDRLDLDKIIHILENR